MTWRLAQALVALRDQLNALSPNRSKISDGSIGNTEHAARKSDHNPDAKGIVHAIDITHDPAHGIDSEKLAQALLASQDKRLKYVISNRKIASGADGPEPWMWRPYTGANPHNHHCHVSVTDAGADNSSPWRLELDVPAGKASKPVEQPANPVLSLGTKGPSVEWLQELLNADGAGLTLDSDFGPRTQAALIKFQRGHGLVPDGIAGPYTWAALLKH